MWKRPHGNDLRYPWRPQWHWPLLSDPLSVGVVIVQSSATATSGDLKEGRESNPMVLDLTFTSSPTGASISGIGLWSLTVFGNNEENGLGPRMSEAMATLQGNDQSFPLPNGSSVEFNSVMATLDLRPYLVCEEVRWVCAELKKQVSSSVDFSLMSESNAHIACTNLNCQGRHLAKSLVNLYYVVNVKGGAFQKSGLVYARRDGRIGTHPQCSGPPEHSPGLCQCAELREHSLH